MLDPLAALSQWERWALTTWLESLGDRGVKDIRWAELPPPRYARALGELATRMGVRLPRRQYGRVDRQVLPRKRDVRASKKWDLGR